MERCVLVLQTFCRKFLWHELMLWPCDMPAHALVVLSHNDDLVPSPLVAAQLAQQHANATVLYHPTAGHGGFLVDLPFQRQMVQVRRAAGPVLRSCAASHPASLPGLFSVYGVLMLTSYASLVDSGRLYSYPQRC